MLPADRGLGESTLFTIVTRLKDNNDKLVDDYFYTLLVDASTNTAKLVNKSFRINVYGDLIFCEIKDAEHANQLKDVTTYDVNGKAKIVCACKDFTEDGSRFLDFCSIKTP